MALATESGGWRRWVELAVVVAVEGEKVTPIVVRELVGWESERKKKRKREMVRKVEGSNMAEDGPEREVMGGD